jgi:hypothetical protein
LQNKFNCGQKPCSRRPQCPMSQNVSTGAGYEKGREALKVPSNPPRSTSWSLSMLVAGGDWMEGRWLRAKKRTLGQSPHHHETGAAGVECYHTQPIPLVITKRTAGSAPEGQPEESMHSTAAL